MKCPTVIKLSDVNNSLGGFKHKSVLTGMVAFGLEQDANSQLGCKHKAQFQDIRIRKCTEAWKASLIEIQSISWPPSIVDLRRNASYQVTGGWSGSVENHDVVTATWTPLWHPDNVSLVDGELDAGGMVFLEPGKCLLNKIIIPNVYSIYFISLCLKFFPVIWARAT